VELDELSRQRQSKSGALDLLVGRPHLPELLKDRLLILGRDADPGIAHCNLNGSVHRLRPNLDSPPPQERRATLAHEYHPVNPSLDGTRNNGAKHLKAELPEKYGVDVNWSNIRPKVRTGKNYVSLPSERRRRIEQLYPKPSRLTAIAHQWLTSKVNAAVAEAEREMQTSHSFVRRSHQLLVKLMQLATSTTYGTTSRAGTSCGAGSLPSLQQILGHADLKMTLRYAHLAPEHLCSEIAKTERPVPTPPVAQPATDFSARISARVASAVDCGLSGEEGAV
jgi:hypothetical protein